MTKYPRVFLKREKEAGILKKRHPWIFSHAAAGVEGESGGGLQNGGIVDVYQSDKKTFFGRGYYNHHSQIRVRLLTRDANEEIDQIFFEQRLQTLLDARQRFINDKFTNTFRVSFGESDEMPGLILDRYGDIYVMQIHTAGMEMLKPLVVEAIKKVCKPKTIYERSDVNVRLQEGLKECPRQHIFGEKIAGEIEIRENGVKFLVDMIHGQKTGFFLDQRENRKAIQSYAKGRRILNCFCYTAGFSVYAALAGAESTVNVDVSKDALETAKRNFTVNGISLANHEFVQKDAFDFLSEAARHSAHSEKSRPYDLVILDPPAFAKNQKTLQGGLAGYLKINEMALRLLPKGGILVSSSCSSRVTDEMFRDMLQLASHRASCTLKALEIRHQPLDHPINLDFPEGKYLKFWICIKS